MVQQNRADIWTLVPHRRKLCDISHKVCSEKVHLPRLSYHSHKREALKVFSGESEAVEKQLQNSKIPYSQLITVQNNRSLQTAYIAYTKDKQKLTEALNNSGFTAIEDVDSFMSDYDKVMIRVAENISQRHLFDSIGLW
mgnify:FL=1